MSETFLKEPLLIPTPKELQVSAGAFTFDAATPIGVAQDLFTSRQIQSVVQELTGLRLPLRRSASGGVSLALGPTDVDHVEGYSLRVTPDGVHLSAATEAGLFYATQTLRQLLRVYGARIPAMTVRDWPTVPHRGVMLDVSRCKVPTLEALQRLVDGLAAYKYNQLQLYVEHTFAFASHPDISEGVDPLTPEEMLLLDAYCKERHVELIPNLQSFGHQRHLLSLPQYSHLDEVGWRWSLTPAREETYTLLSDLYADFLPNFASGWLNVDCDETWDLATGQSRALAQSIGKGRVYLQHIQRLHELGAKYGRRIMLWADVLHHYPDLVPELPEDVLLLDWEYEAAERYPTTETLGASRRPFWVCPGTSSWNTLFPRLDNAVGNIRQYVSDGLQAGASGMLLTDWGDYGHYSPLSLSWYPYLFGAATSWTGAATTPEQFDAAFAVQFLGRQAGDASVAAMRRLGRAVTLPGLGLPNRSNLAIGLFEDPRDGRVAAETPRESLVDVRDAAEEAIAAWASLADPLLRWEHGFTARLIAFTANKLLRTNPVAADRNTVRALREEFETVWLRQARRSEIDFILGHFDSLLASYDGEPVHKPLLWQQGQEEHRKLAELA